MNLKLNNKRSDIEIQEQLEKRFAKPSSLLFPSILKVFGYSPYDFRNRIDPTVFTELANMTLKDVINLERAGKAPDKWNLTKKLINIYGIAAGMKYLNIKGIVHRNLNLNSILLDDSFYPKISDFKLSKYFNEIEGNKVNKEELNDDSLYIAHEIRSKGEEYISSDVYSFSIIAYEIITKESPSSMPYFNANVPDCYKNLILNCYDEDPNKRPTFDNIVDVLKTDKSFIVDGIDSQEYLNYIKLIDEYLNQTKQSEQADQDNPTISFKKVLDSHFRMESRFMVDINDYVRIEEIGKGCDSLVFSAQNKKTKENVAAKVLIIQHNELTNMQNIQLFREVKILSQINHPSLLKFIGYSPVDFNFESQPTLITELCHGTLKDVIELERKGLSPPQWNDTKKLITIFGIANGMKYLHSMDIVHRDLKPANILEDEYLFPKISDFGLSKKFHQNLESMSFESSIGIKGTPIYISPEVYDGSNHSKASDVYSFAFIVYEIVTCQKPYEGMGIFQIMTDVRLGMRPEIDSNVPYYYQELIEACWNQDAENRPTFDQIVDVLKDEHFLTELIDQSEYFEYVDYIESETYKNKEEAFSKVTLDLTKLKKEEEEKDEKKNLFSLPNIAEFDLTKLEKQIKVGNGAFAKVYKVYNKENNEIYAAKILKKEICDLKENEQVNLSREIKIISSIKYQSIIKFIGYCSHNFKSKQRPVIITEMAPNHSLRDILELERNGCAVNEWDDTKKFISIYGIAAGMKYLHSLDILHRDLKPENILLDEYLFPKITDFGLSKINSLKSTPQNYVSDYLGTPLYMAPEIWKDLSYTKANDVYAFALILYEIMTNEVPLKKFKNQNTIIYQVCILKYRPKFNVPIPECYQKLIESCWSDDPEKRPSFDEIVELLKTDPDFITDNIDIDELIAYSELINEKYVSPMKSHDSKQKVKIIQKVGIPNSAKKINELTINSFSRIIETNISNHSINNYILNLNDYEQKELIRKNEFSKTYKVIQKDTNNVFAAKISNIDMNQFSKDELFNIAIEFNSISLLNHPSIIKFVGFSPQSYKGEPKPVVITEIYPEKTLDDILKMERRNLTFPEWNATKRLISIYGIASAMKYLHSHEIIHRNLNPTNVFLDKSLYPKLHDFGLCTQLLIVNSMTLQTTSKVKGLPVYSAPEILDSKEYSKESDVYSFGMIVYEMITRENPLNNLNYENFISDVVSKNKRPKFNKYIPDCYRNLIEVCWSQDPSERFSFEEIVDFIQKEPQFITSNIDKNEFLEYIKKFP